MSGTVGDNTARASGVIASAGGGGAWTLISTQTASSDTEIDFTTLSADYLDFKVIGSGCRPSNADQTMQVRFFDTTPTIITSSEYVFGMNGRNSGGSNNTNNADPDSSMITASPTWKWENHTKGSLWFEANFSAIHNAAQFPLMNISTIFYGEDAYAEPSTGGGALEQPIAVGGIRFFPGGGTIVEGEFTLYGRKIT